MAVNRCFKQTPAARPNRSPSPPRRYVEPISPSRPSPVEPRFINYPALDDRINFTVRPETTYAIPATPHSTSSGAGQKRGGHHRTTSSIDQLAEAALAISPNHNALSSSAAPGAYSHAHPPSHAYGGSEPPHKRSRSELLPSPLVAQYASRPATSYEPANGWYNAHPPYHHPGVSYDSRVEEAALLLNFRTGGLPAGRIAAPPPPMWNEYIHTSSRPHAHGYPQDALPPRTMEMVAQMPLLPPFNPPGSDQLRPTLPSPQQTIEDSGPSPQGVAHASSENDNVKAIPESSLTSQDDIVMTDAPQQMRTPPDEVALHGERPSRLHSADVTASEASEAAPQSKRGWPKGKPRSGRKTMAEKAAKGKVSRRKTPDAAKAARKDGAATAEVSMVEAPTGATRRESFSVRTSDPLLPPRHNSSSRAKSVPADVPLMIRSVSPSKTTRKPKQVGVEMSCAGCTTARESAKALGELDSWISCNGCKSWFHVDCAGFRKTLEVRDVDKYFCPACVPAHGETTFVRKSSRAHVSVDYAELQKGVLKTSEESNEHHYIQPIKDGTFKFDPESFPRMPPELVTKEFLERSSFTEPICIPAAWNPRPWLARKKRKSGDSAGTEEADTFPPNLMPEDFEYEAVRDDGQDKMDMVMPEGLTVRQVCNLVGPDWPLDVIETKTQNSGSKRKWTLSQWTDYYEQQGDDKPIRNVISLEVSQTKLGRLLRRPKVVRDIDLQDEVWPQQGPDVGKYPKVQFYCLMSIADSYTDFHIDFGGSSVYYHILKGKKTFLFIPPKPKHLKAYEEWNDNPQQNHTFLPSITNECYRVDLSEGDTMLIPSGWIHAVWTPETSLVIGGNFLSRMSFRNQFKVVDIELANGTPQKFRYPSFQKIMWLTAIKYLQTDPLPPAVSQAFYEGQKFERKHPIWADFDGEIAENDPRPGAHNARYYSQAEVEGLPDLAQYIFKTVLMVEGCIEGISQDRMKRINASIPKAHGPPLEVAKTFGIFVAWKTSTDPPAWSHPSWRIPKPEHNNHDAPKKLSARALKEIERKEAFAAWRIAPDRQSARINKAATPGYAAMDGAAVATPEHASSSIHQPQPDFHQQRPQSPVQNYIQPPFTPSPIVAMTLDGPGGHFTSTPKTSVLGPKRVACDTCRKRRIKCKHKDLVTITPSQLAPTLPSDASYNSHPEPDFYDDNITVTPPQPHLYSHHTDEPQGIFDGSAVRPEPGHGDSQSPAPGTNAYLNANIPMTLNGTSLYGEAPKRGRVKACYECRRSKRRCVHDDSGNVDPVKAAETPVSRGSVPSKKRSLADEGASPQIRKKSRTESDGEIMVHVPMFQAQQQTPNGQYHGPQNPQDSNSQPPRYQSHAVKAPVNKQKPAHPPHSQQVRHNQSQPPIDPSLFSLYHETAGSAPYINHGYPFPAPERPQQYQWESLEQIANEVLDMNGNSHEERKDHIYPPQGPHDPQQNVHVYDSKEHASMSNGFGAEGSRAVDGSVDSAVSFTGTNQAQQVSQGDAALAGHDAQSTAEQALRMALGLTDGTTHPAAEPSTDSTAAQDASFAVQPSVEASNDEQRPVTPQTNTSASPNAQRNPVSNLPLYKPPAPPSQSPEQQRRQPVLANGVKGTSPHVNGKRKQGSFSDAPDSPKKAKLANGVDNEVIDARDLELAKALQQNDRGLRRRS